MDTTKEVVLSAEEISALKTKIQEEIDHIQNSGIVKRPRRTKKMANTSNTADSTGDTARSTAKKMANTSDIADSTGDTAKNTEQKKWNRDIYLAAHSGDTELYGLASVLVFFTVRPFFSSLAVKYQNSAQKPEIDDFMNELYIKILQMLDQYNPEFTPITWLKPWAIAVFQTVRDNEIGITTTHYFQNTLTMVKKARNEIELAGNTDPSDYDIYEYLSEHYPEKHISLASVERCRTQNFSLVTADTNPYLENTDPSRNPERAIIAKGQSEDFEKLKDMLTQRSRIIIEIEHEYIRQNGDLPDIDIVFDILSHTDPTLTVDIVSRMVNTAHQEVRRTYNRMRNRKPAESVITLNAWQWDDASLEDEERMLLQAIEDDPSILEII